MGSRVFRSSKGRSWAAAGFGFLGLLSQLNCSSDKPGESRVDPCGGDVACGQTCSGDAGCASGQYCSTDGACKADCVASDPASCGPNATCNSSGRCQPVVIGAGGLTGSGGTSIDGSGGSSGTSTCVDFKLEFEKQTPTVLLLVDQSRSMNEPFGTGDRWSVLRSALLDQQMGLVGSLQKDVRFGLALYSSNNGAAPCPAITSVPPALTNYAPIEAAYPVNTLIDDTPTGESIDAAAKLLADVTEVGQKVIVLATDGEPDTCADPDPSSQAAKDAAKELSVKAAENAFAAKVFTFVISVGDEISTEHLTKLANVGQGFPRADATPRFYRANNQSELASAFDTIIAGVRSCVIAMNGSVRASEASKGDVKLDGQPLTYNDKDGWRLNKPNEIELLGTACEALKAKGSSPKLQVTFPCGSVDPS